MKRLIELAEMIKNKDLREKTIKLLKEPEISNSEIIYPKANFEEMPAWIGGHHAYKSGLIEHTYSVTKISLELAKHFEKLYKVKINYDYLIAGALLHDIMKVFIITKIENNWTFTGSFLDHAVFSAAELYSRNFPEEVIHIVASHGGDLGTTGANPRTIEALIVFYADVFDSAVESFIRGEQQVILIKGSEE